MAAASDSISVVPLTKSENGVAGLATVTATVSVDYTAYPPPLGLSKKPAAAVAAGADKPPRTPAQAEMHEEVLLHFQNDAYRIPGVQNGKLLEEEKFWLSNDCLLRYLRATKWGSAKAAIGRLEGTLKWRREFGMYNLTAEQVEPEAVTGKEFVFGYDTHRRPALYMVPSRQNTEESPRQLQFAFWMLERALDLTGPGVESIVLMINFADKGKNSSFSMAKQVLDILQMHYPERLGASLILNVPFLVQAFFKMISPFIDPVTRNKMKFNPKPVEDGLFKADGLVKESGWGGSRNFEWDHEKYWPQLVRMCAEITAKQMARWRRLGARVGCDEWDYKSEDVVDISPTVASKAAKPGAGPEVEAAAEARLEPEPSAAADDAQAPPGSIVDAPPEAETEIVSPATAI
ncbi:CRAL-TRIO domain-containing protein [Lactifluus subvellereus]|nr:CRAL-TRIO domain-containing protein [Lactifluus subvellereus]